jgi:putative PEP-CTERM system TPR-repeat lipoprotein
MWLRERQSHFGASSVQFASDRPMKIWKRAGIACLLACSLLSAGCDFFLDADARVSRAQQHMASADYRAAMIDLKNAVQDEPDHIEARLLLAEVSLQLGDPISAEKELRFAIDKGAQPSASADLAARIALALGQRRELLARIDSGELPLPEPQRSMYRGQAWLGLDQSSEAAESFQQALSSSPNFPAARIGLAEALFAQGQADKALAELDSVIAADPESAHAHLVRGTILARRGLSAEAEEALRTAQSTARAQLNGSQQVALLATLTETQLSQGNPEQAGATYKELSAIVGADAPLALMLGARIAMSQQDYAKAAADLQRVIARVPDFAPAQFLLGAALMAQGNLNQAEMHLTRALQRAPENLEARKLLAQVRLRMDRPDSAMQVLMSGQTAESQDPQLDILIGLAHLQLGDATKGIAQLERALTNDPQNRPLRLDLATAYARAGDHAKAVEILRTVSRLPGDTRREQLLVAVQAAKGLGAARAEVERLVREHPRDADILNFAALFLAQQREFEGARALLARAEDAAPDETATLMNRARVEVAAGNVSSAIESLREVIAAEPASVAPQLALAELQLRQGDVDNATQFLEKMRSTHKEAIEPRLRLARLYLQRAQVQQAEEVLAELRQIAAGRAEALNAVGLLLLDSGRYDEALTQFRAATQVQADNALYWLNVARAQLALDQRSAARETLDRATALRPQWLPAVGALALLDIREKRREAALNRVATLKRTTPADAAVWNLEGDILMSFEDYGAAAASYARAFELQPGTETVLKLFRAHQQGKLGDAISPLRDWLEQQPDDFAVRAVLAQAYQAVGQHDHAIQQYELMLANDAMKTLALNNLAWSYQQVGDERAEATAEQAYRAAPTAAAVADTYGWILVQQGKAAEGLDVLKKAVDRAGNNPDIEYHYAAALAQSGERSQARDRLRRLLERREAFAEHANATRLLQQLSSE